MLDSLELWVRDFVESYGYVALFLLSYTESIFQPLPPDPFIAGGSALGLDPFLSAIVATTGSVLGGLTAHTLGLLFGRPLAEKFVGERSFLRGEALVNRFGVLAVLVSALTPIPFKVVCWLAGVFRMPRIPFLLASVIGRLPRFLVVAFGGNLFL